VISPLYGSESTQLGSQKVKIRMRLKIFDLLYIVLGVACA
jgi:hypothetical protein